ncbi:MAG: hypothetical protein AAGJ81_10135 [Verrucomicrobiota bacterium]
MTRFFTYCREHQIFRFYLLVIPVLWAILLTAVFSLHPRTDFTDYFSLSLWSLQAVVMVLMMILSTRFMHRMIAEHRASLSDPHPSQEKLTHLVLLPCYNEPVKVLMATLDSLAEQTASHQLFVVISLEEKSPDRDQTKATLEEHYRGRFQNFYVTVHPANIVGEIRGKCSNVRWAISAAREYTDNQGDAFDPDLTTLTSMDSDTILHRRYFEVLGDQFLRTPDNFRFSTIWQSGLFYNYGLADSLFFTRVTALLRSIWMTGFNIPLQVHPMSVFSTSLKLGIDNNYFDPTYQMDDMHFFAKSMATRSGSVYLKPMYLPLICGPTSGKDFGDELKEWALQAKRWTIGAFEIFHYVASQTPKLGLIVTIRLLLTILVLYGLFQSILFVSTLIASPFWHSLQHESHLQSGWWYVVAFVPWVFLIWCFVIDWILMRHFSPPDRGVSLKRNVLHFVSAPIVLLAYNLVSFYAIHVLAIRGKAVCTHDVSAKNNLPRSDSEQEVRKQLIPEVQT